MKDEVAIIVEKYGSLEDAWCNSRGQEKVLINFYGDDFDEK